MTLSELSIRRPVLAAVLSLLIVVAGLASISSLPIRELPDVDSSVVSVTTTYTGAAPEIVDTDITEVIDSAVAGISGVKTITSSSQRGRSTTTIEFELGRDIDEAAGDVRAAVARVRGQLPDEVDEPQVVKSDSDADPVMRLAVYSDRMTPSEVTDYLERFIVDRITTIDGVANVRVYGERRAAIRIWLDRGRLAAHNLTVADVEAALRNNNVELPAGEVESNTRLFTVRLDSRLSTPEQFSEILLKEAEGAAIRLGDVARVNTGVEDDSTIVRANGLTAIGIAVQRQSQSNTIAISNAVKAELARLNEQLPEGMQIFVGSDDAVFVSASIKEVVTALAISLVLVVLVILVFLRSVRATLIPAITIPVSLIGCFSLIYILGFSLNVLTLLALLLAIGLVVDDAIVMLENIERRLASGETKAAGSSAWFAPGDLRHPGDLDHPDCGVRADLVPAGGSRQAVHRIRVRAGQCSGHFNVRRAQRLPRACLENPESPRRRIEADETAMPEGRVYRWYRAAVKAAIANPVVVIALCIGFAGSSYLAYKAVPQELTPTEDRSVMFIPLTAPQGSSLKYTDQQVAELEDKLVAVQDKLNIDIIYTFTGFRDRPYRSFIVLRFAPWDQRENSIMEARRTLIPLVSGITGARGFPVMPSGLGLRGSSSPLRAVVGGPDYESVQKWAEELKKRAEENPGLANVDIDFEQNQPQFRLTVDRKKADDLGISTRTIASTLQTMLASREITNYIDRGREYPVIVQGEMADRQTPDDISSLFIRTDDGRSVVPLSSIVTLKETSEAPALRRYNRLPSVTVSAALNDGYALGNAIDFVREQAAEVLPPEASLSFSGQSQQYLEASSGVWVTFVFAILIVFLVLAGQFESFMHPLIIMLSVPLAVAGALYSLVGGGLQPQHLFADRHHPADRPDGKERHPDR
jgi:multidrug efflux pump